jgi:hypothetical protein
MYTLKYLKTKNLFIDQLFTLTDYNIFYNSIENPMKRYYYYMHVN